MNVTRSHSKTQLTVDLWLPAGDLHHAVQVEVLQVPLLPVVLIDLSLSDDVYRDNYFRSVEDEILMTTQREG